MVTPAPKCGSSSVVNGWDAAIVWVASVDHLHDPGLGLASNRSFCCFVVLQLLPFLIYVLATSVLCC